MIRAGIIGATGYTGYELVQIFQRHPEVQVVFATSESYVGKCYAEVYPCPYNQRLIALEDAPLDQVDVVFLCTPHGTSAVLARQVLDAGAKCIDLSADFRLRDVAVYEKWYKPHPVPGLLPEAVYGLPEVYASQIAAARLVANPGCYPTGPLLALYPLLQAGIIQDQRLILDAKSGVSGAGASPSPKTHFVNVHDNLSVYNAGHSHRHVPEIEQELQRFAGHPVRIVFTPHLLPVSRGILTTIYITVDPSLKASDIVALWEKAYAGQPCIHILPAGETASLAHTVYTNRCALSLTSAGVEGEFILVTSIDNLVKGASGQAVQNMNVMFGLNQAMGLIV